jgi:hypothetical protein
MAIHSMDTLEQQTRTYPDKTPFVYGDDVWTHTLFAAESERLARYLLSQVTLRWGGQLRRVISFASDGRQIN